MSPQCPPIAAVPQFSLIFYDLDILVRTGQLCYSMLSRDSVVVMHFLGGGKNPAEVTLGPSPCFRGDRILKYLIPGNITLDHEVKVVVGFSTVRLLFFTCNQLIS